MEKKTLKNEIKLDNPKVIMQSFNNETKIILPNINDNELLERYKNIKPIVYNWDDYFFYYLRNFNLNELKELTFLYDINKNISKRVKHNNCVTVDILDEFSCYHKYKSPMFFKPTIAEILSQFPDELLNEANAFYLYEYPKNSFDLNNQFDILNAGCHKSKVRALKVNK